MFKGLLVYDFYEKWPRIASTLHIRGIILKRVLWSIDSLWDCEKQKTLRSEDT